MPGPSFKAEQCSTEEFWSEAVDKDTREGDLDSFNDDKDTVESPLAERVLSVVESKEDVEDDTEGVCWVRPGLEDVQEEEEI